jgi:hypothetical protein
MTPVDAVNLTDSASADFEFPSPGTPGYDEFRKTGKLPSTVEDSAPPKEIKHEAVAEVEEEATEEEIESSEEEDSAPSAAVTHADSAPAPRRKANGEQRKNQLQEEIREAARVLKEIREETEKLRKPASQAAAAEPEKKVEPKTESEPEPDLGGINVKTGKPFATIAEFQKEHTAWLRAQISAETEGRFKTVEARTKAEAEEKFLNEGLQQKFAPGVEKYSDFKEVVGNPALFLPRGSAADIFIRNSDNAAEMAYHLGKHPEILAKFYRDPSGNKGMTGVWENAIPPSLQMIELARLELQITSQNTPKPPARTITQAPRPPHRVSGQAPTADPLAKAVEEGDQAAYVRLENEKQLARMRERNGRRKG